MKGVKSMEKSLERVMKDAVRSFKCGVKASGNKLDEETAERVSDNYYILERCARNAARECRSAEKLLKGSELLPSLFFRCVEMCKNGEMPDEKGIIDFLKGGNVSGRALRFLPLAITCALVDCAAKAVRSQGGKSAKLLENALQSLRKIGETDFDLIEEKLFVPEEILMQDPTKIYPEMDSESKRRYRYIISKKATSAKKTETQIVQEAFDKASANNEHIGKYLISRRKSTRNGWIFLAMEVIMPLVCSAAVGFFFGEPAVAFLLFFPLWEILRCPIESASMKGVFPKRFYRLRSDSERVCAVHALLTVSTLLPSADKMNEIEEKLEEIYLSNAFGNTKVCCLADFKAAGMPRRPEDKHIIKAAKEAVDRLNKKHGGGFVLAIRPRSYSETQNEFIGKERKRGAITQLIRAIKGNQKGFVELHGDADDLEKVKYLIALDWDTRFVFDSARELIAVAEHPMNAPVIKDGRVVDGCGILVPKTQNRLGGNNATLFSRIFAGDSGITAYDSFSGERYQDLFGESIFCGKGLINVDAYYDLLDKALPRESVLSHDIVESGYLRAGYVSDVQITEAFPQSVGSYYSRLHRWVRGDWQNAGFVFGKNPMNALSRWKIFDNLRRSATPVLCMAAIFASLIIQGYAGVTVAVLAAVTVCSRNIYGGVNSLINGGASALFGLYYSNAMPDALSAFVRAFALLALSAKESFVCLSAICKALWRMIVSRNNLLEWSTAAQSEKENDIKGLLLSCLPSIAVSSVLLILGLPIHRFLGLIILFDIPITLFSGAKAENKRRKISEKQRESLMSYASAMWGFFDENCGRENSFLPPDNIQLAPARAVAKRTSPTNIGLMLASFLAARDLGLITTAEMLVRFNLSLGSIEKLEKYKGNLLNWYSTSDLKALNPRFVSTVDSGNFLCCLTAVKEGLKEYVPECEALREIIAKIEKLIEETDLSVLYNKRRELFYIGIDADSGEKSKSCYDLYMSEIRMTSYFAVASRAVPKKHWGTMGRIHVAQGRYSGVASWTGTMFEYFMPNIFLPAPEGSLSREALCFCLQAQRKRTGRRPYGISESGFYAFDADLNYQYKAHGVQKLGLKRGLDSETVISPYSTFLTLTLAPQVSLKNLLRLEKMGMTGKYGFFEAVDFTRGRNSGGFSIIRSFMAHHVGMSLLSVDNLLKNQCMQRRFMRDSGMRGAKSLLEEKVQGGTMLFKDIKTDEKPHLRERVQSKNTVSEHPEPFSPKATVYSNGRLTTCITDTGTGVTLFDGIDVTVNSSDPISRPQGFFAVLATDNEIVSFTRAICSGPKTHSKSEFFKDRAVHEAKKGEILLKMRTELLKRENCEIRKLTVTNTGSKGSINGDLMIYFEPCLEKRAAYAAHPAFSKLFLVDEWDGENQCMVFSRRARDSDIPCAVAAGFLENIDAKGASAREKVLKTPMGVFSLGKRKDFDSSRGNPDCCCAFSVKISLAAGEKAAFTFAMVVEDTKESALNTFLSIKAGKNIKKLAETPFAAEPLENSVAEKVLPRVLYPRLMSSRVPVGVKLNFGKADLWSFGVSGELPIILIKITDADRIKTVMPYLRLNKALRNCGIATDLVVLYPADGGYEAPIETAVKKAMQDEDCGLMIGVRGGVHLADLSAHSYEQLCALQENSAFVFDEENLEQSIDVLPFKPLKMIEALADSRSAKNARSVKQYNFTDGKIAIKKAPSTVDIPWTMVFANRSFGTMVSDKALGFTWALNSRENKLTPWHSDTMSDNRGEMLILKYNGILYDLISLGEAVFTPEKAVWTAVVSDVEFKITVSVPQKGMTKKCTVETNNKSSKIREFDLMYYVLPVLGVSRDSAGVFHADFDESCITVESSASDIRGFLSLECKNADYFCLSRKNFLEGNFNSFSETFSSDCCAAVGRKISLAAGGKTKAEFFLSWGACEKAAKLMPHVAKFGKAELNPMKINMKDKNMNLFFNSFLYSQIKQSRFFARTGFYQCSGAYGFRDQLQDCLAFIDFEPRLALTHIVRCAAVQFEQGDVLHWWHVTVDGGQKIRGIRTKCSDDMLWLPFACLTYFQKTGDKGVFNINAPYLLGDELSKNERERYFSPQRTKYAENILMHCIKAIDYSMKFGDNGFPLIGSCDWNDGFSRIGDNQSGESVWLAMFQKLVLDGFSKICADFGMTEKANEYNRTATKIKNIVQEKAWDSDRFSRAFLRNGKKLGENRDFIDILPQAFAVLADIGTEEMKRKALNTAYEMLYDRESGVVRLLSPSFDEQERETVGYIASYPDGIRENGGQYTHAAVWLAKAMLDFGEKEKAFELFSAINPLSKYKNEASAAIYRAEPYVLAGDVSFGNGIRGRAGWTHFTGSAAWFYRTVAAFAKQNNSKSKNVEK